MAGRMAREGEGAAAAAAIAALELAPHLDARAGVAAARHHVLQAGAQLAQEALQRAAARGRGGGGERGGRQRGGVRGRGAAARTARRLRSRRRRRRRRWAARAPAGAAPAGSREVAPEHIARVLRAGAGGRPWAAAGAARGARRAWRREARVAARGRGGARARAAAAAARPPPGPAPRRRRAPGCPRAPRARSGGLSGPWGAGRPRARQGRPPPGGRERPAPPPGARGRHGMNATAQTPVRRPRGPPACPGARWSPPPLPPRLGRACRCVLLRLAGAAAAYALSAFPWVAGRARCGMGDLGRDWGEGERGKAGGKGRAGGQGAAGTRKGMARAGGGARLCGAVRRGAARGARCRRGRAG
jgi:hypothetical protein